VHQTKLEEQLKYERKYKLMHVLFLPNLHVLFPVFLFTSTQLIFLCPGNKVGESFSTFCMKQKVEPRLRFATDGQAKVQAIQNAPLEWPGPRTTASH
jgi:hypothetical protein